MIIIFYSTNRSFMAFGAKFFFLRIKDYLANRKQHVIFNGLNSDLLSVNCGVPQGVHFKPTVLLYINDLSNISSLLSFILFADDTNISFSHNKLEAKFRTGLRVISYFMHFKHLYSQLTNFRICIKH